MTGAPILTAGSGDIVTITSDWVTLTGFNISGSEDLTGIRVEASDCLIGGNIIENNAVGIDIVGSNPFSIEREYEVRNLRINHNDQFVWTEYDGNDEEIYFWDGVSVIQITDNDYNDFEPLLADKELYVYGLDLAKKSILEKDFVICVEGQFDCIACHKMGIDNVVALGWATLSRYQAYQLSKYTKNIVLMFDNDSAGKKGVARAKSKYSGIVNIESLFPPQGYKDIDEFFKKEASIERKENAVSLLKNLR